MDKARIKQVLELAKEKKLISVNDLIRDLGWCLATAQRYLLELEIEAVLERIEDKKESGYTFKYWRLKKIKC